MPVRKSINLLTLLLSVSAPPFVVAATGGRFVTDAALPSTRLAMNLSNFRASVIRDKALVDKGDLVAARTDLTDLDRIWDGVVAGSTLQTGARWSVIDRAIDRGLDRALLALRPHPTNIAMGDKALADLVAVVDQVSGADGERPKTDIVRRCSVAVQAPPSLQCYETNV
jgi:hypothetical protein